MSQYAEMTTMDVMKQLQGDEAGLSKEEQDGRREQSGENRIQEKEQKGFLAAFAEQLQDPLIYVLMAAIAISVFLGESGEAAIIAFVILMNATIGVIQEGKARKAIEALKELSAPKALIRQNGIICEVESHLLVPGDIVLLEAGRQVPADLRLLQTEQLKVEESALTGESLPVEKDAQLVLKSDKALGDRINMAYMSTFVTSGRGEGIVVATGMHTEIGKIAGMINQENRELTPLQRKLGELGKVLSLIAVGICALLFLLAVWQKRDISDMLLTAISLAVAAVPEGLPAIVTIVLAMSVSRMVKVNTIVRRLPSVETLGAVNVICSDKTGTLTQNKMTITEWSTDGKLEELIEAGILCNDAWIGQEKQMGQLVEQRMGDPTELAFLDFAMTNGWSRDRIQDLRERMVRQGEVPFDSVRKRMTVYCRGVNRTVCYSKGALEALIDRCSYRMTAGGILPMSAIDREQIRQEASRLSTQALRVLALAKRELELSKQEQSKQELSVRGVNEDWEREEELTFLGLVGMMDPPRPEVTEAIEVCKGAGIDTIMITGDHVDTAFAIARKLGIAEKRSDCMEGKELDQMLLMPGEQEMLLSQKKVFARVSPENKVQIVQLLKKQGKIVAMTGDGINDAPSLQCADVGIAMGKGGTDVARNAADLVLTDDHFATIVKAVEEGRGIFENIRKTILFLLSSNFGEIITMVFAVVLRLPMPLRASHILWVNLITDSLPALALGTDQIRQEALMRQKPRDQKLSLFAAGGLTCTLCYGFVIAGITLAAFLQVPMEVLVQEQLTVSLHNIGKLLTQESVLQKAQTHAFTVLGMSQLMHALGMRDIDCSVFKMKHLENKLMLISLGAGMLLQMIVTEVPYLVTLFGTSRLHLTEWVGLLLLSMTPLLLHEMLILCDRKKFRKAQGCAILKAVLFS